MIKKHDHNAVSEFQSKTIDYLRGKGVEISEIIEWTDHCLNQYKSRKAFYMLTIMDILMTQNFFSVKHGKGPSDQAGAHFKNFIAGVVKSKKAMLSSVKELAEYSSKKYEHQVKCSEDHKGDENSKRDDKNSKHDAHNLIKVMFTDGKIVRDNSFEQTVTYKGTHNIHSI